MAPDKIYIHIRTEPRPSITFSEVPEKNSSNEEYIRKDALLEWAKEKAEDYKGTANIRRSFEMMIRKIEAL